MRAYKKEDEKFIPVILELETQEEVDFVRAVFGKLYAGSTDEVLEEMSGKIIDELNNSMCTMDGVEGFKALLSGITL